MDHQVHTLPNGIRLLFLPNESIITHACILVNAGSRDENEGKDGLAHFIEHLLFKRTEKRGTRQILNYIEAVGGDLNAYTTKEYTCIHASFLNPYLNRALDLFEDLLFHSTFPEKEMDKEKGVVIDEIASYLDQPEEAIQDDFEDMVFSGHKLGRNILGTMQSVKTIEREDIVEFIQHNYTTGQIVVGVTGRYAISQVIKSFSRYFGAVNENTVHSERTKPLYYIQSEKHNKPINQSHCILGSEAYSSYHPSKTGLMLLNNIIGGAGMSSILNLSIREKYGIAYSIESNYSPLSDTGLFSIYFGTDAEKFDRALRLINKELKKLREQKLSTAFVARAKKKFNGLIALGEESKLGLIISMSKNLIDYNQVDTLEEVFTKVDKVSADDLLTIANEVLDPRQLSMLTFMPEGE